MTSSLTPVSTDRAERNQRRRDAAHERRMRQGGRAILAAVAATSPGVVSAADAAAETFSQGPQTQQEEVQLNFRSQPGDDGITCATYSAKRFALGAIILATPQESSNRIVSTDSVEAHPTVPEGVNCPTTDQFFSEAFSRMTELSKDVASFSRQVAEALGQPELAQDVERLENIGWAQNSDQVVDLTAGSFARAVEAARAADHPLDDGLVEQLTGRIHAGATESKIWQQIWMQRNALGSNFMNDAIKMERDAPGTFTGGIPIRFEPGDTNPVQEWRGRKTQPAAAADGPRTLAI